MKIFFVYLIVVVSILVCSCQRQAKPETNFFRDFNLGGIVEKMNVPELKRTIGWGGAGVSNGKITERRNSYYLEYHIEEQAGERFNEAIFFDELKVEVEKELNKSDVRIGGAGFSSNK